MPEFSLLKIKIGQVEWNGGSIKDNLSKFIGFKGTCEQTFEPMKPVDKLVEVADDLGVVTAKVHLLPGQ